MKTPPLLLAATILFWGIESSHFPFGLVCAVATASVCVVKKRFSLSDDDLIRVSDLTSVIFLSAVVLTFINVEKVVFLKTLVEWMPVVLLPLLLTQLFTGKERIIIGTRFGLRQNKSHQHEPLDFRYYYLGMCFISTAMANSRSMLFFPIASALFFWLLIVNRGRSFRLSTAITICCIALGMAFISIKGWEITHTYLRAKTRMMMRSYYYSKYADPFHSHLSFGDIGRLKSSDEIILRLQTSMAAPRLLRQASYELFEKDTWHSKQPFTSLPVSNLGWDLNLPPEDSGNKARIDYYLPREKGLMPHPYGSYRVEGPTLYELEQKQDGITHILDGAPVVSYDIYYNGSLQKTNDLPNYRNRNVSPREKEVLQPVIAGWKHEDFSEEKRVELVKQFFLEGFSYSLDQEGNGAFSGPLENFIYGNKKGYCELFATTTTLLLRLLEIPSRYVTGYIVAERSDFEDRYLVREKHAHAWSEAFVNGRWIIVDTTPAGWFENENEPRSLIEKLSDIISYYQLQFAHFRIRTEQNYEKLLSVITVVLTAILIFRIYRRMNAQKQEAKIQHPSRSFSHAPSPLNAIEQQLLGYGIPRYSEEPFMAWASRIHEVQEIDLMTLNRIHRLHLVLRFDPAGLSEKETDTMHLLVENWLSNHTKITPAKQTISNQVR